MQDALLDHLRALAARAAQALGGHSVMQDDSTSFVIAQAARNWEMPREIAQVRLGADLEDWHAVYREVFGADINSLGEWQRLYEALGPSGDNSLILHLARVGGAPAATAAVFLHEDIAGLYCFTTRRSMRDRGLASALIGASHSAASARGINRALLHATPSGRSVYAKAGYIDEKPLPVLIVS